MKRFIAEVKRKPGVTDADVADHQAPETELFKQFFDSGLIWDYYKQLDAGNFWLIVHSASIGEARAQLQTFPFYSLDFISIEVYELAENVFTRQV